MPYFNAMSEAFIIFVERQPPSRQTVRIKTYRRMRFQDIQGHEEIKQRLREMADSDRIPHALLFNGQPGVGKMQMARAFAQYVQCTDRHDGDSCGRCPACLQNATHSNPDLYYTFPVLKKRSSAALSSDYRVEWEKMLDTDPYMRREHWLELIDAGNGQPAIYVAEASEISRTANLSSYSSNYKIYIIWLPEAMQPETANKLLKLIEEPWENTLFLLVSNDPGAILPTIYSRTQRINFHPLSAEDIAARLMKDSGMDQAGALRIGRRAEGSMLRAQDIAMASGEDREFGEWFRLMMRSAYGRKLGALLELSEQLAALGRERIMRFLQYCSRMVRENYLYNFRLPQLVAFSPEEEEFSRRFSPFINERNVEAMSSETDRAYRDISRNANSKIVLYDYMLQITRWIRA